MLFTSNVNRILVTFITAANRSVIVRVCVDTLKEYTKRTALSKQPTIRQLHHHLTSPFIFMQLSLSSILSLIRTCNVSHSGIYHSIASLPPTCHILRDIQFATIRVQFFITLFCILDTYTTNTKVTLIAI